MIENKSRFGFHTCSYDVYLKLKQLNKYYQDSQRLASKWFRWIRKSPHNRKGEEPKINPVFCKFAPSGTVKWDSNRSVSGKTYYVRDSNKEEYSFSIPPKYEKQDGKYGSWMKHTGYVHDNTLIISSFGIDRLYQTSRIPFKKIEDVPKNNIDIEKLNNLLNLCENWAKPNI